MTECPHCLALVWVQERSAGSRTKPLFSICCGKGQISIAQVMPYNRIMELLRHKTFFRDIRKYNSAMAFASMRCNLDHTLASARKGAFTFRISGQVMHKIGSVFPTNNQIARIFSNLLLRSGFTGNHAKQRLQKQTQHHASQGTRILDHPYQSLQQRIQNNAGT